MFIHSDILTEQDIRDAVPSTCYLAGHYDQRDGVTWASIHVANSRSRAKRFSVRLSGSNKRTTRNLPDKAATWDEWGIFIAAVFKLDPDAKVGWYKTREDFMEITRREHERISQYRPDLAPTHTAPWLYSDVIAFDEDANEWQAVEDISYKF